MRRLRVTAPSSAPRTRQAERREAVARLASLQSGGHAAGFDATATDISTRSRRWAPGAEKTGGLAWSTRGTVTVVRGTVWQDEVHRWACAAAGESLAPMEHVRTEAWSTVWRARGGEGTYWFKESTPSLTPEGPVHAELADLAPDQVTAPVAWDVERGWMLSLDGGQVLQDLHPEHRGMDPGAVKTMLRSYASLQRATVGQWQRLRAAGLPDRSPSTAGRTLMQVATAMAAAAPGDPRHITEQEFARLKASATVIEEAARCLQQGPVPLAFDHSDLFPRNVFVPRVGEGYRFFDFGESLWSHPFESLLMLVWELVHQHKLQVDHEIGHLDLDHSSIHDAFDAYLDGWRDFADLPALRRLTAAALQIAPLYRAERWMEILARSPAALDRHGSTPRAWIFDIERRVRL